VFNNSFSSELSSDGQPIFSAAHPLVGGGTFSNTLTGDFGVTNLQTALNIFDDMRDDRNLLIDTSAAKIIYAPALQWIVDEVLHSEKKPGTNNNNTNSIRNQAGLDPLKVKYLTGAKDWFIGMSKEQTKFIVYWRKTPVTDSSMSFDTGNMKTKMTYRLSYGVTDWRGFVGAQGV